MAGTSGSMAGKTAYIIDANSLIFQVFHALPEMSSPQGESVNAVFGFTRDVLFLLQSYQPDYLLAAFDMPGPTFRHQLYDQYKAHRTETPAELIPQFPKIRRMLEAFGVPVLGIEGYEADDLLATLARRFTDAGGECYLVTADKDIRQLLNDHTHIYNVRKNQVYDAAALMADWGVRPEQVVDFQSLVGDPVDNVPGIPLIGPKVASELLAKYGTLENLLDHAHEVSGAKRKQNLLEGRDKALLSRSLVKLDDAVPVELDWQAARSGQANVQALVDCCQEFGFHRFVDQIRQLGGGPSHQSPATQWQRIDTPSALDALCERLLAAGRFSFDTETTGLDPLLAELVGVSLAIEPGQGYYIPVRGPAGERLLGQELVIDRLRPLLENPGLGKIGQNLKYDMLVMRKAGVVVQGAEFDTLLASYLLDAGERNHNLDELAQRYLGHQTIPISQLIGSGKQQRRMDEVAVDHVAAYAAEDADIPLRLQPILAERLEASELVSLYRDVEMPLVSVLTEMEHTGIRIDVERLGELSAKYATRIEQLQGEIYALAGREFNIASPKQLQQILFDEQGLPVITKTKTGPSTDASVLEELARLHALPAKIIEFRQYAKLKGTYVDALPQLVNPHTQRVHCSFHQAVTATGRLSSSDPNLQNIPIRTPEGREIRSAFVPGHEDWLLLSADYSQIELRVLAHLSGDETLCHAFACDEDIHARVASEVYGVPLAEVTGTQRRAAKAVNFGVVYGQSPFGLAKSLGIEQDEASEFIDSYFARYPGVEEFMTKTLEECRVKGYVTTILGRRRSIQGVRPNVRRQRNLPERTAINTVIQGSAADLIKLAMLAVARRLARGDLAARMLLQIHDELLFEVEPDALSQLADAVSDEMSSVMQLAVPLKVDRKSGRSWAETEPWS